MNWFVLAHARWLLPLPREGTGESHVCVFTLYASIAAEPVMRGPVALRERQQPLNFELVPIAADEGNEATHSCSAQVRPRRLKRVGRREHRTVVPKVHVHRPKWLRDGRLELPADVSVSHRRRDDALRKQVRELRQHTDCKDVRCIRMSEQAKQLAPSTAKEGHTLK